MTELPVEDEHGNALRYLDSGEPQELWEAVGDLEMPLSLVIVRDGGRVLLGFNRWRSRWELPGGTIDDEESPQEAAERGLYEQTGVSAWGPALVGVATLEMSGAREAAALYEHVVGEAVATRPSEELIELMWWDVMSDAPATASPIDVAIARWVVGGIQ